MSQRPTHVDGGQIVRRLAQAMDDARSIAFDATVLIWSPDLPWA
jgi:hypothetical protein